MTQQVLLSFFLLSVGRYRRMRKEKALSIIIVRELQLIRERRQRLIQSGFDVDSYLKSPKFQEDSLSIEYEMSVHQIFEDRCLRCKNYVYNGQAIKCNLGNNLFAHTCPSFSDGGVEFPGRIESAIEQCFSCSHCCHDKSSGWMEDLYCLFHFNMLEPCNERILYAKNYS